jgi:signal transduction histidine kinase
VRRQILLIVAVLVTALAALAVVGSRVLDADRARLYERYAHERLHVLEEAGRVLERHVREVAEDLDLAATLLEGGAPGSYAERQLHAIATIKREYLLLETRPPDGPGIRVVAHDAPAGISERAGAMVSELLGRAARAPGELVVSGALGSGGDPASWYRVLARRPPGQRDAIAAVIDMRVLLARLDVLRDRISSLFIVGGDRRTTLRATALPPALYGLVELAQSGGRAIAILEGWEAAGQPQATVAVASLVRVGEAAEPWTLVRVSSAASLRAQERTLVRRLVVGGCVALGLLLASAGYMIHNARRTAALRERLRLEERLLHSEKLVTAGQLAAGIAHEIGTPLNVVRGRAELALSRLSADHPSAPGLQVIIDEVDRVTRLLGQLLDYVRPSRAEPCAVDVAAVAERVAILLGPKAGDRGVALAIDAPPHLRPVRADPDHVQQILVNLVMNALDASPRGGRVAVRARPARDAVVLEVEDDGPGIPPDSRPHVFDPFFTTKKRGQGTGLGLWVVAQLIRAHGGEIEVADAPGGGALMRITWPALPVGGEAVST